MKQRVAVWATPIAATVGYVGFGLGVAAGAAARASAAAGMPDAVTFWGYVVVIVACVAGVFRATRLTALAIVAIYAVSVAMGFCLGHPAGNFIGWHPD